MTERIQNFRFYYPPNYNHDTEVEDQSFILILIHGLNGNLLTWTPTLAPSLAKAAGMRVLTFDQPCYGQNPLPFKQIEEFLDENDEDDDDYTATSTTTTSTTTNPIQEMISQLETIMKPNNLAVELFKFLQAVKVIPSPPSSSADESSSSEAVVVSSSLSLIKQIKQQVKKPFIHLFGQSFGGKTAISFADKYPFLVASVTLGDIGIVPCQKYDEKMAHQLAAEFYTRHTQHFPDEQSVKNYVQQVFGGEGGDDVGKKYTFDTKTQSWVSLVRPHVGFIHDFLARKTDLRDAWIDFEGPVMAVRAGDEFTCLSDQEWKLMRDLRRQAQPEIHDELDVFVTPSAEGFHGVYRSHEELFVQVYSEFVKKVSQQ